MLAKLERAYLNILRVVILIAATIALVIAAFGLVTAVPPLLKRSGLTSDGVTTGGSLQDFIKEQKITETTSDVDASAPIEPLVLPDIREAARLFHSYLGKNASFTEDDLRRALSENATAMTGHAEEYAASIKGIAQQLKASKGKPLSETRVLQLIGWHKDRFAADIAAEEAEMAEGNAKFWTALGVAGACFLGFILIVFVFIFVKIERSLRVVQTQRVVDDEVADARY